MCHSLQDSEQVHYAGAAMDMEKLFRIYGSVTLYAMQNMQKEREAVSNALQLHASPPFTATMFELSKALVL